MLRAIELINFIAIYGCLWIIDFSRNISYLYYFHSLGDVNVDGQRHSWDTSTLLLLNLKKILYLKTYCIF